MGLFITRELIEPTSPSGPASTAKVQPKPSWTIWNGPETIKSFVDMLPSEKSRFSSFFLSKFYYDNYVKRPKCFWDYFFC